MGTLISAINSFLVIFWNKRALEGCPERKSPVLVTQCAVLLEDIPAL
jgi:hypothetical protein